MVYIRGHTYQKLMQGSEKMPLYSDTELEMNLQMLNLLTTIEEALCHMLVQLNELRLEESGELFKDIAVAISSIANSLLHLITDQSTCIILSRTTHLREAISQVADAYEVADLLAIKSALTNYLIPAFTSWQREIGQRRRYLT